MPGIHERATIGLVGLLGISRGRPTDDADRLLRCFCCRHCIGSDGDYFSGPVSHPSDATGGASVSWPCSAVCLSESYLSPTCGTGCLPSLRWLKAGCTSFAGIPCQASASKVLGSLQYTRLWAFHVKSKLGRLYYTTSSLALGIPQCAGHWSSVGRL